MLKKVLTFIIVLLIAIQIPLIITLSNAKKAGAKIEAFQAKIKQKIAPISAMGDVLSLVKKQVPILTSELEGITSIFEKGKQNFKEAKALINNILQTMYASLIFTLLLIVLLFFLYKKSFFKNIGLSFVIGGVFCLINAGLVYYFFVFNFNSTFKYFYELATATKKGFSFSLPFVSPIVKSFSQEFVAYIANSVITRSLICALIFLPLGVVLMYFQNLLVKKIKDFIRI